jgi:hypothetical protein
VAAEIMRRSITPKGCQNGCPTPSFTFLVPRHSQITPQMRILVAIDAVDGRKGIDSSKRLCEEKLQE